MVPAVRQQWLMQMFARQIRPKVSTSGTAAIPEVEKDIAEP